MCFCFLIFSSTFEKITREHTKNTLNPSISKVVVVLTCFYWIHVFGDVHAAAILHDRAIGTGRDECSLLLADATVDNVPKTRDDAAWQRPDAGATRHVLLGRSFEQHQHSTTMRDRVPSGCQQLRAAERLLPLPRDPESIPAVPHLRVVRRPAVLGAPARDRPPRGRSLGRRKVLKSPTETHQ